MKPENCVEAQGYCLGCGVCCAVCPAGAIAMLLNAEGFYEASIATDKCIKCGKCLHVCPKFPANYSSPLSFEDMTLYAAWSATPATRQTSSSGGIATELMRWGLENGYNPVGVVYNYQTHNVQTVVAQTLEQVEHFKTSKYLQSWTADCFKELLQAPRTQRFIVVCSPCQAAALHAAATTANQRDKFILIDFLCHGVPSRHIWTAFLLYLKEKLGNLPDKVNFRNKKYGWHTFCLTASYKNKIYRGKGTQCPFYALFFSDLLLNKGCYECVAKKTFGYSDIRIADFWGDYIHNQQGISAVLPISAKGKEVFQNLTQQRKIHSQLGNQVKCRNSQAALNGTKININQKFRQEMICTLKNKGIKRAVKLYYASLSYQEYIILKLKENIPFVLLAWLVKIKKKLKNKE